MTHNNTRTTGSRAEQAAVDFLISLGYAIVARNYFCRHGELDIIAGRGEEIIFVEVKSIVPQPETSVYELLSAVKLRRLQFAIDYWLLNNDKTSCGWRFAYIAVTLDSQHRPQTVEFLPDPEL